MGGNPDENAKYYADFVVDLDIIDEPMIADPDVHNEDVSKRYTHDTIRGLSFYEGKKHIDLGFVGSCMVHNPGYDFNDEILPIGATYWVKMAEEILSPID